MLNKSDEPRNIRLTIPVVAVLKVFAAAEPGTEHFAARIHLETGIQLGTLYRVLPRLEAAGWLTSRMESKRAANKEARPPRRYYRLTKFGKQQVKDKV